MNISARTGRHLEKLVPALEEALESWDTRVPTAKFNAFLAELVQEHPHPLRGGKQPRVLFGTQVQNRPPTFVLFTSGFLDPGYRRFIQRRLRESSTVSRARRSRSTCASARSGSAARQLRPPRQPFPAAGDATARAAPRAAAWAAAGDAPARAAPRAAGWAPAPAPWRLLANFMSLCPAKSLFWARFVAQTDMELSRGCRRGVLSIPRRNSTPMPQPQSVHWRHYDQHNLGESFGYRAGVRRSARSHGVCATGWRREARVFRSV